VIFNLHKLNETIQKLKTREIRRNNEQFDEKQVKVENARAKTRRKIRRTRVSLDHLISEFQFFSLHNPPKSQLLRL
jgi:pimeloyl-CoA synthetase